VRGHFLHAKDSANYKFDKRAMEGILTDIYNENAFNLSQQERFKEVNLPAISHEIEETCRK
jgi:hypothetical protein